MMTILKRPLVIDFENKCINAQFLLDIMKGAFNKVNVLVCAKLRENLLTALLAVPVHGCKSDDDSAVYLMTMSPLDFVSTISITPINIIIIISINFIT